MTQSKEFGRHTHTPIVINWHVTEACNYQCSYCYAEWDRTAQRDVIRDPAQTQTLLQSLYSRFGSTHAGAKPRLNIAGGEPLLHADRVVLAMKLARSIGFDVSLISNGSRLNARLVADLAPELTLLGLSIDATHPDVMAAIGRQDRHARRLDLEFLAQLVNQARHINPALALKINTVVCSANWEQDLSPVIEKLAPQRWKVLRVLPAINRNLEVTDWQFRAFVERHSALADVMCVEDNDDMVGSYIMVDPSGRFFQNRCGEPGYDYSPPILEVGAADAFDRIGWNALKFYARYTRVQEVATA